MAARTYDVIIGAGPVGENVADRVVQGGLSAAIVERELTGGERSYWACMPTKALLRSAAALRAVRRLPGAREAVTGVLDAGAVLTRDAFASHWKDERQVSWLDWPQSESRCSEAKGGSVASAWSRWWTRTVP